VLLARFVVIPILAGCASAQRGSAQVDFEAQVWPILERNCIRCHSAPKRAASGRLVKPKAGVRLDSAAGIRSGQRGEVVQAGRPERSLLYTRITLPKGDADIMPPAKHGDPLTKAQTDLIERWIGQGAKFGAWRGSARASGAASGVGARPEVKPPITGLAFAPDGRSVVACSQAGVQVRDWPSLRPRREWPVPFDNVHDLAFSPGGGRLAIAGGDPGRVGVVEVLPWPARTAPVTIRAQRDSVHAVAWRDAATFAAASLDHGIVLADARSGKVLRRLTGHSRGVTALCFLRGGELLVSAGIDQSVRVWDVGKGELVRSMDQHTRPVHDLALRPAKEGLPMVASAAADRTIRFWQPTIGRMVRYVRLPSAPLAIAWLGDGARIVAACRDGRVRVVDAEAVTIVGDLAGVGGLAYSLAAHPTDGSLAVGGQGGEVRRVVLRSAKRRSGR
jgi:WD40 repeat protein